MLPSKTFLSACLIVAACLPQFIQSLSIPPPPTEIHVKGNTSEGEGGSNNGFGGDLIGGDPSNDDAALEQSSTMNKEAKRDIEPSSDLLPPKSRSNADGEFTNKIETATTNSPMDSDTESTDADTDSSVNLDETQPLRPEMEVVEIVLRPFKPPSILVLDFFKSPNDTISSNSSSATSAENDSTSSENNEESTTSESETSDDGEDENSTEIAPSTFKPNRPEQINRIGNSQSNERRKRETHQNGNDSQKDDDSGNDTSSSSSSSNSISRSLKIGIPRKFERSDDDGMTGSSSTTTTTNPNSSVNKGNSNDENANASGSDEDDDNGDDDNGQQSTNATKSGTVKIFLEILQLVPLSNSTSDDDNQGVLETTTAQAEALTAPDASSPTKEANSNKNIPSSNDDDSTGKTLESGVSGAHKRILRSATATVSVAGQATAEKKSNPSSSLTASATPSSGAGKNAPAAPLPPSTNGPASSTAAPDNGEGPPLLNVIVTENDDD